MYKSHYENVPFEIPENWRWTTIDDVNLYNSSSIEPNKSPYKDFELYSVPTFESGMPEFVKGSEISSAKKIVAQGDVLLCKINPHLNRAWIVTHYDRNRDCIASSEWIICRNNNIEPRFLAYCFTSPYFMELMLSNVSGVGGSLMRAQPASVGKYIFPLPPIKEQIRIVVELDKWLMMIDELDIEKQDLFLYIKQIKSKILDLAISGKLVPQDPDDEPAIELLKRINPAFKPCDNSHYENLPQGWELVSLNSIVDIISGVSYAKSDIKENGVRILRGGNIQDGEIICLEDDVFIDQSYSNIVNSVVKGDIVLVASTGSPTLIGKTGYARITYPDTQIGAFLRIIRPKTSEISAYLNLIFNSDFYKNYIRSLAKGTNINNVKNGYIEQLEIALPPIQEQERIVKMVENIFISLDNITAGLL